MLVAHSGERSAELREPAEAGIGTTFAVPGTVNPKSLRILGLACLCCLFPATVCFADVEAQKTADEVKPAWRDLTVRASTRVDVASAMSTFVGSGWTVETSVTRGLSALGWRLMGALGFGWYGCRTECPPINVTLEEEDEDTFSADIEGLFSHFDLSGGVERHIPLGPQALVVRMAMTASFAALNAPEGWPGPKVVAMAGPVINLAWFRGKGGGVELQVARRFGIGAGPNDLGFAYSAGLTWGF